MNNYYSEIEETIKSFGFTIKSYYFKDLGEDFY